MEHTINRFMTYIILLNYNGWKDTIECLESLYKLHSQDYKIILCDNNSTDNSLTKIVDWANNRINANIPTQEKLRPLVLPYVSKPIEFEEYNFDESKSIHITNRLTIIKIKENKGFAAGNNIGIKIALNQDDCQYVWCLNNDTIVDPLSLTNLVETMNSNSSIGICGAKTKYYFSPSEIQCDGGFKYNKWTSKIRKLTDEELEHNDFDYINGASMMINPLFIETVGFMNEDYFLYNEEIDWAVRNNRLFLLTYCPQAVIYHKEGSSIGGNSQNVGEKSYLADFYSIRSRINFTKKYYPTCLPTIYLGLLMAMINRIKRKQYSRIGMILKLMINPSKNIDCD